MTAVARSQSPTPGQGFAMLHEAVEQARRENEVRNDRTAALLLAASMVATTGYAVWFVSWQPQTADRLVLFAAGGTVSYAVALALHGSGRKAAAGILAAIASAALITSLSVLAGSDAMFQLNLLGIGLAVPLLLPPRFRWQRVAATVAVVGGYVAAVAMPASVEWLTAAEVHVAATVNQFAAAANLLLVGVFTHTGFARARALLQAERALHRREAETDQLTGLANRRPALEHLRELVRSRGSEFSVALIDLDEFKLINDTRGHDCGDAVLIEVANALEGRFRSGDLVCRWGGDEFLVVLDAIGADDATRVLGAAVACLRDLSVACGDGKDAVLITASGGIVSGGTGDDVDAILAAADQALYAAKEAGRDRVEVAT